MNITRILELALRHKKHRVRKKNLKRFVRIYRQLHFVNPFDRMREDVVFHEYEHPEDVYVRHMEKE